MELETWLNTDLQKDIWKYKYRFENETLDEFFDRVAESSVKDKVKQIRSMLKDKMSAKELADIFNISERTIKDIEDYRTWRDIG
jgi:DNA-binding XRE family transcriptional regulator